MIYLSLLIALILVLPLKSKKVKLNKKYNVEDVAFVATVIVLFLICSLRSKDVGRDTNMYYILFNKASTYTSLSEYLNSFSYFEYGYWIFNYLFAKYLSFQLFITFIGALSIFPAAYIINKYSKNKILSLILYIGFPFFTFSMQALRQAPALGMMLLSYDAIKQKNPKRHIFYCFLGFMFHTSAILFAPAYWIGKIPYKKWLKWIVPLFIVLSFIFRHAIQNILMLYSRQIYTNEDAGGYRMFTFIILTVFLGMYYRIKFIRTDDTSNNWKELFYFQAIVAMMWPIASFNPAMARMYYYYQVFLILFVPQLTINIKRRIEKNVIEIGYIFVAVFFLIFYQLPEFYKLVPYTFFWQ